MTDVVDYNRRWLQAWTDKDVDRLVAFYAPDTVYQDPNTAEGLHGREPLRAYLTRLFAETPPMRYDPDEVWATDAGYCGRWICTIDNPDGTKGFMRGFDLVVLKDDLIALNEVYVHMLAKDPRVG